MFNGIIFNKGIVNKIKKVAAEIKYPKKDS